MPNAVEILDGHLNFVQTQGFAVLFPLGRRTQKTIERFGLTADRLGTIDLVGYLDMIPLKPGVKGLITDSGRGFLSPTLRQGWHGQNFG